MRMFIAHPRGRGAPPAHQLKHDCPGSSMLAFFVFSSTYNVTANSTMFPVVVAVVVVLMLLLLAVGGGGGGCCGGLWCLLLMLLVVVGGGQLGLMMAPKWSLRRQAGQDHSIHPSPPQKKKSSGVGQLGGNLGARWHQAGPKLAPSWNPGVCWWPLVMLLGVSCQECFFFLIGGVLRPPKLVISACV